MQYMILIYEPEGCYDGPGGQAALQGIVAKHMALAGELRASGVQKEGAGLQGVETATTVATGANGQQTLHDGPFAETREHLGGYYVIDVPNLDDALAMARRVPVMPGGKVEVRPLIVYGVNIGAAIAAARPRVVAALAGRLRDLDLAEDAFADASAAALTTWPNQPPRDPAAWLWRAALRRAIDAKRRAAVRGRAVLDAPEPEPSPEEALMAADQPIPDERLKLIFVCCHPAIAPDSRAALTLKVVCGLSTPRLARAFFTAEPAMLQRITRAKKKIATAGVPFEVPGRDAWPERLEAVLTTLEIAYAQAYEDAALAGETAGFAAEVLRLSGLLAELMPDEPEVLGLAALVRFAEARRPARLDDAGAMVPPPEQDTGLWRRDLIAEGAALLDRAADLGRSGPRQILATIHACHCARAETGATPWADIAALYDILAVIRPHAATAVNRAVAIGEARGAAAGLTALAEVNGVEAWLPYQAALAELSARADDRKAAAQAYRAALALDPPPAERLYLQRRLREITPATR